MLLYSVQLFHCIELCALFPTNEAFFLDWIVQCTTLTLVEAQRAHF